MECTCCGQVLFLLYIFIISQWANKTTQNLINFIFISKLFLKNNINFFFINRQFHVNPLIFLMA